MTGVDALVARMHTTVQTAVSTLKPIVLITGASAGIGEAFARIFAAHGQESVLVARRADRLHALADEIEKGGAPRPAVLPSDLGAADAPARLADALDARRLEPAVVVNNAGFGMRGRAADLGCAEQIAMIDLNVRVLTDLSLRWVDSMTRHRGGVINVASIASFFPGPGMAVYHACKAYVLSFSEALHQELASRGIRVTVLCPGPVPTEFHERAGIDERKLPRRLVRSAQRVARDGYEGFIRGERLVVPGFANKVVTVLPRFVPRAMLLGLVERHQLPNKI
jgi:uncharacterized protein